MRSGSIERQVGERGGLVVQGGLQNERLPGGLSGRFLVQLGRLGKLACRFTRLGELERGRLAVVTNRDDLIVGTAVVLHQHDLHLARRLRLHLPPHPAADRLLDRRPGDENDLVGDGPGSNCRQDHETRQESSNAAWMKLLQRVASGEWRVASKCKMANSIHAVLLPSLATRHPPLATLDPLFDSRQKLLILGLHFGAADVGVQAA